MSTMETYQFTVGRSTGCEVRIDHSSISRAHAKIYYSNESVLIEDLNSERGTYVLYNGDYKRIRSAKVKLDTLIRFGTSLDGMTVRSLVENFQQSIEKDKKDIAKRVKGIGHKRCSDCGTVVEKNKIHCDCCGAIFEESA